MLTWCSSAGNICWADWLGCLFDSSSISYLPHIKRDHQWFIVYTAPPCNVNAFIKILICSYYGKVIKLFTSHCCVFFCFFVWNLRFPFYWTFCFFSLENDRLKWQQLTQHAFNTNTQTNTHAYTNAAPLSHHNPPPSPQVSRSLPQGYKSEWVLNSNFSERSLWDGFRVNICRIGTVSQSIHLPVILADRWLRADPWYQVRTEAVKSRTNKMSFNLMGRWMSSCIYMLTAACERHTFLCHVCTHTRMYVGASACARGCV